MLLNKSKENHADKGLGLQSTKTEQLLLSEKSFLILILANFNKAFANLIENIIKEKTEYYINATSYL